MKQKIPNFDKYGITKIPKGEHKDFVLPKSKKAADLVRRKIRLAAWYHGNHDPEKVRFPTRKMENEHGEFVVRVFHSAT